MAGEGPTAVVGGKIAKAAERCARIVKNFLALARQQPMECQTVSFNRVVEDSGIRSEPRHGKLVDIALECAAVNQVARNVVEPQTLTQVVKELSCFHLVTS